jgi:hypothetical protein
LRAVIFRNLRSKITARTPQRNQAAIFERFPSEKSL